MFDLQPTIWDVANCGPQTSPPSNNGGCYLGQLGNTGRDTLRGPGFGNWDFSIVKDTAIHALGEQGSLQFRMETFNLLNRANFGMPDPRAFNGNPVDFGTYSETPNNNVGKISMTSGKSRQIQFALKVIF